MIVRFNETDLQRNFERDALRRGFGVMAERLVRRIDVSREGLRISSSVSGSARQPYSQSIALTQSGGQTRITAYCTCPVGRNCKHSAGVLLSILTKGLEGLDEDDFDDDCDFDFVDDIAGEPRAPAKEPVAATAGSATAVKATGDPRGPWRAELSSAVTGWLDRLCKATRPAAPPSAAAAGKQRVLRYVLDPSDTKPGQEGVCGRIRILTAAVLKAGRLGDIKHYDPANITRPADQRARFLSETDVLAMRDLIWVKQASRTPYGGDVLLGDDAASLRALQLMLSTGSLRYGGVDGPVLAEGGPVRAEPQWIRTDRGEQRLAFMPVAGPADGGGGAPGAARFDAVLALARPYYVDLARGCVGPIETTLSPELAAEVARAPVIAASEAAQVKELMRVRLAPARRPLAPGPAANDPGPPLAADAPPPLPLPEAPDNVEVRALAPVPRLELFLAPVRLKPSFAWYASDQRLRGLFQLPLARVAFDYGGQLVPSAAPATMMERVEGDRLVLVPRDEKLEAEARARLDKLGLRGLERSPFEMKPADASTLFLPPQGNPNVYELLDTLDEATRFITFSAEALPVLAGEGWQIAFSDDYPYRIADGEAQWWAETGEGSGIDWFSFELGIEFEGHRINLVPQLAGMLGSLPPGLTGLALDPARTDEFQALCGQLRLYHTLPDGRLLPLPGARLAPILRGLIELVGPRGERVEDGKVRLHRAESAALSAFAGAVGESVAWAASAERLIALGRDLRRGRHLTEVAPPPSFKAKLRPYQRDGLAWLEFLREARFGGVLADDMGLGKTVQALAFLAREKAEGRLDRPAIIVSPTSVLPNWQAEAERFAPELSVLALRGLDRKSQFGEIARHDLVLTTYPLLVRDHEVLLGQEFHAAILDEAQAIKNPKANVSGLAHRINARHRLALTGTPLENNLGEVWSLFEFLSPGLLGDESTFRRTFRTPIEKHGDQAAQAFLSRRLKPFMLRRTKLEVAKELPPKTEIVERVRLEGPQRDLYETVRVLMDKRVREEIAKKGLAKSHIVFLDALLKLRQICCDPRLLKMPQARKVRQSAKLERLMEMLPEMVAEGRRILLFSQFTSMLELIEAELGALKIPYVQLTGDTVDRAAPVRRFQAGEVPLFLLSLKAGGTGLNLTAADTVIHYDPWWNPAVENQATDRAYRIGQDKPVFVYKLMVEEGIEEAIELLKRKKAALAEALFAGSSKTPLDLTEADISALFAPLDRRRPERKAA